MTKFPEVISTVKRRRAWSAEEKVAILDAAFRRGGSVAAAADWSGVSRALIYIWRSQVRDGLMPGVAMTDAGVSAFAPVSIGPVSIAPLAIAPVAVASDARTVSAEKVCRSRRIIEVRLVNGRSVKMDEAIAPDVLARIVAALDGERS